MKKLNLIKKMMLVASTAFMASSLVFVPGVQNKEVKLNKNKNFTAKTVILKNEARDIKYICQTMEFNEKWLEVTDVQRISGKTDKFTEIDFSDLTVEGDIKDYEIKSINIIEERISAIYDKSNFKYVNFGHWKLISLDNNLLKKVNLQEKDLRINIGKEVFDPEFASKDKIIYLASIAFKEIILDFEQHERYQNLIAYDFSSVTCEKMIFQGARMAIDYRYDITELSSIFSYLKINEFIFNNEITGFNSAAFYEIKGKEEGKRAKLIFNNTSEKFDIWAADYEILDDYANYVQNLEMDIFIPNKRTKINLKKYKFEPQEKYSEWYWSLVDFKGLDQSTLNITQDAYDAIQADPVQKARWEEAKIAGEKRTKNGNNVPWYQIIGIPEPSTINSSLVVPGTNKVNVDDTIQFVLNFTGESGYFINNDKIKLFQKNSEGPNDQIVDHKNYSIVVNDVESDPNIKIASVKFLKPFVYNKLVLNYVIDETNIIRDSSAGVDIEVIGSDPKPTPDESSSNSNNLIIIGASAGAGALVASTATGIIISKKRKRSKQL